MANAISSNRERDLWKEVKKVSGKTNSLPNVMDNVIGDGNIADLFAEKYSDLYNSVI